MSNSMKSRILFFFSLQTTDNERESTKRKRLKSIDSDKRAISAKNKKMARALNIDPKEDGEISDDYDDSDDDSNRSHSPAFQRKQIVYEIDDDSSSTHSGRHSPYNEFSGEWLTQFTRA